MRQTHSEMTGDMPIAKPTIPQRWRLGTLWNPLQVIWFRQWNTELDQALSHLPESDACPHRLFRLLATNPSGDRKIVALVREKDAPVAIAALRRTADQRWVPVTHYIVPGAVLPTQPGRLLDAVAGLGVTVKLGFWRQEKEPEEHDAVRSYWSDPTFGMDVEDDWEAYWRKTGRLHAIRAARKKCGGFSVAVNQPGAAKFVIREWGKTWGVSEGELLDRIAVAEYLEAAGRHVSILLTDHDHQVGGATYLIHDGELVAGVYFRNPAYNRFDVGTYILYLTFEMASKFKLTGVDLGGGGQAYKHRYAPMRSEKHEMRVCGNFVKYQFGKVVRKIRMSAFPGCRKM